MRKLVKIFPWLIKLKFVQDKLYNKLTLEQKLKYEILQFRSLCKSMGFYDIDSLTDEELLESINTFSNTIRGASFTVDEVTKVLQEMSMPFKGVELKD